MRAFILCITVIYTHLCYGQRPANNAVALGLGGSSSAYLNAYAIDNNVAALPYSDAEVIVHGTNRFGLADYSQVNIAAHFKTKGSSIGASYSVTPFGSLQIQQVNIGVAKKLGEKLAAGVALQYHQYSSIDAYYQSTRAFTFQAAVYYQVNEELALGFQTFNPNRTQLIEQPNEQIESKYQLGVSYLADDNITLYADATQSSFYPMNLSAGVELSKGLYTIRGGFGLQQLLSVGMGYTPNKLQVDVGISYHNQLGITPALNIAYAF